MTLKQWLKGKHEGGNAWLPGCKGLYNATENKDDGDFNTSDGFWFVDVLSDGTAITYCGADR